MGKFRVLHISNNLDEYPHCVKDTDEFPHVVKWVEDEYAMFILDEDTQNFYPAGEFFYMTEGITTFDTETQELEDELLIATTYISSTRDQCAHAANGKEEHLACWAAVTNSPLIVNDRISLTDKDRTYLAMKRTKA